MKLSALLCVAVLLSCSLALTPTPIPFLGNTAAASTETPTILSVGQVITQVSQVSSYTFQVAGQGAGTAQASIAQWDLGSNTASPAIKTVSVTLPNSSSAYTAITALFNLEGLDPNKAYAIYFVFPSSIAQQYKVATIASSTCGAYVQAVNGVWSSGFNKDVLFSLVSTNTMPMPYGAYSVGTGKPIDYNCYYNTSFTKMQVNWQTLTIYTGCFDGATTVGLSGCAVAAKSMPLGVSNTCWWASKTFSVDLRGTNYQFDPSTNWAYYGWPDDQSYGVATFSNNRQTVVGENHGDCSTIKPTTQASADDFGYDFYIKLKYIGQ